MEFNKEPNKDADFGVATKNNSCFPYREKGLLTRPKFQFGFASCFVVNTMSLFLMLYESRLRISRQGLGNYRSCIDPLPFPPLDGLWMFFCFFFELCSQLFWGLVSGVLLPYNLEPPVTCAGTLKSVSVSK